MGFASYADFSNFVSNHSTDYEEIRKGALELLNNKSANLGHNVYLVYENLIVSILFGNFDDDIESYLSKLVEVFPKSSRVLILLGMAMERNGRYDDAISLYEHILEEEQSTIAKKRLIAITKIREGENAAIYSLTSYLKIHMNDVQAWMELTDLYINQKMYDKAKFCVEELMVMSPNNCVFIEKYVDILMKSSGDLESLLLCRKYLSFCLFIDNKSESTLKRLIDCCVRISKFKIGVQPTAHNTELFQRAKLRLSQIYQNISDSQQREEAINELHQMNL